MELPSTIATQEYELPISEARMAQVLVLMTGCMQAPADSRLRSDLIDKAAHALQLWARQAEHTPVMRQLLERLAGDWCGQKQHWMRASAPWLMSSVALH